MPLTHARARARIENDAGCNARRDFTVARERSLLLSPYHLMYEATIEDPKGFTRPWKMRFPLYRRIGPGAPLMEFTCVEFADERLNGRFCAGPSK